MSDELVFQQACYDHRDVVELTRLVQDFYRQVYGGADDTPLRAEEFAPPHGRFLVGYLADHAAAMGGWRFLPQAGPAGAARSVELKRMFVRPELRGRGLGLQMLQALERSAAQAGADWMLLETGQPQLGAVALYRSAGYREVPPFGFYAGRPGVLNLGRPLDPPRA